MGRILEARELLSEDHASKGYHKRFRSNLNPRMLASTLNNQLSVKWTVVFQRMLSTSNKKNRLFTAIGITVLVSVMVLEQMLSNQNLCVAPEFERNFVRSGMRVLQLKYRLC